MSAWQPIATAPRDGTPFIGACPDEDDPTKWEVLRMSWYEYQGLFGDATYAPFIEVQTQPTKWMPLPDPNQ